MHTGAQVPIRPHSHLRTGALPPGAAAGHHEAQAVPQGHGADRPGGRHPDLQDPLLRHGGGHRGRGGHAAIRCAGLPPEERIRRGPVRRRAALRVPALAPPRRGRAPACGRPDPSRRRHAGGRLPAEPVAALCLPVVHQLDGGAQQERHPVRVRRGKVLSTAQPPAGEQRFPAGSILAIS